MAPILSHSHITSGQCGFNQAASRPADPHQAPSSTQRTQSPEGSASHPNLCSRP